MGLWSVMKGIWSNAGLDNTTMLGFQDRAIYTGKRREKQRSFERKKRIVEMGSGDWELKGRREEMHA